MRARQRLTTNRRTLVYELTVVARETPCASSSDARDLRQLSNDAPHPRSLSAELPTEVQSPLSILDDPAFTC
jgi:hypothetical protein